MKIKELIRLGQFDAAMRLIKITDLTDNENLEILFLLPNKYVDQYIAEKPLIAPRIDYRLRKGFQNSILYKKLNLYNYLKKYISNYEMVNYIFTTRIIKKFDEIETDKEYKKTIYSLYLENHQANRQVRELLAAC